MNVKPIAQFKIQSLNLIGVENKIKKNEEVSLNLFADDAPEVQTPREAGKKALKAVSKKIKSNIHPECMITIQEVNGGKVVTKLTKTLLVHECDVTVYKNSSSADSDGDENETIIQMGEDQELIVDKTRRVNVSKGITGGAKWFWSSSRCTKGTVLVLSGVLIAGSLAAAWFGSKVFYDENPPIPSPSDNCQLTSEDQEYLDMCYDAIKIANCNDVEATIDNCMSYLPPNPSQVLQIAMQQMIEGAKLLLPYAKEMCK
ncbi:MAG: hypothetical protein ACK5Z5_03885 [Neisseriaceae bacterium]